MTDQTPQIPDVDIDLKDRDAVLSLFPQAVEASQIERSQLQPHKTGVYFQKIPTDPVTGRSSFPYEEAELFGYYKVDLLPNHVYDGVRDQAHLDELVSSPVVWEMFEDVEFVKTLFHFGGMVDKELAFAEVVAFYKPKSVMDLAVLVALKLPAKKHLIGEDWAKLREAIWTRDPKKRAQFKKSHAVAYAMCIIVDAKIKATTYYA